MREKKQRKPLGKWTKKLIISLIVLTLIILFGSLVLYLGSYILVGLKTFLSWIIIGMRWLAKVLDFLGFTGLIGG